MSRQAFELSGQPGKSPATTRSGPGRRPRGTTFAIFCALDPSNLRRARVDGRLVELPGGAHLPWGYPEAWSEPDRSLALKVGAP